MTRCVACNGLLDIGPGRQYKSDGSDEDMCGACLDWVNITLEEWDDLVEGSIKETLENDQS